jgi:hypothetical protein
VKHLILGLILTCLASTLYAQSIVPPNQFTVPPNQGVSGWQQLYPQYPIIAQIQCRRQGGLFVTFEYTGQGRGCYICFTVTDAYNYVFTPGKMTKLPNGEDVPVAVRQDCNCDFPICPPIAIALDRVVPYVGKRHGGHPPMLRPCKPPIKPPNKPAS